MHTFALRKSGPLPLKSPPTIVTSLGLFCAALLIAVPVYGGGLSGSANDLYRFGMPLLWAGLALATTKVARLGPFRILLLSLFGVSLGFALAHIVNTAPQDWLGLPSTTPPGATAAKIGSEVIPLCASIFFAAYLARLNLGSLSLIGGRIWLSLGLGLLTTIPLLLLFVFDPSGGSRAVLALPFSTLLSWLPWIAAYSIGNGFMEELWFRGFWLTIFKQVIGPSAAMHVTSWAFCVMHVIVYWQDPTTILILTPVWLFMGYAYATITSRTGSLWGAVLAHAAADVLFMSIYFTRV